MLDSAATRQVEVTRVREHALAVARLTESQMLAESRLEDVGAWGTRVVTPWPFL